MACQDCGDCGCEGKDETIALLKDSIASQAKAYEQRIDALEDRLSALRGAVYVVAKEAVQQ